MNIKWLNATGSGDLIKVRELLEAGIAIDSLDRHGQTALMNAVLRGDVDLVRLLIEHGADLDRTAKHRLTALMLAVINNRPEIVALLVDAGADPAIKGSKGPFDRTPLEYAESQEHTAVAAILRNRA